MFGDFFQRAGNFFTGSGWVSDDEERKKKRRQQAQPKPQTRTPQGFRGVSNANLTIPQLDQKRTVEVKKPKTSVLQVEQPDKRQINKPPILADPNTGKLPQYEPKKKTITVAPAVTPAEKLEKRRQVSSILSGVKYKPSKNYLTPDEYSAILERKKKLDAKPRGITTGDVAIETGKAVNDVGQWLLREMLGRPTYAMGKSAAELVTGVNESEKDKVNRGGFGKFFLGDEGVKTYQQQGRDADKFLVDRGVDPTVAGVGGVITAGALAALDSPVSKPFKAAAEALKIGAKGTEKLIKGIADKVIKDAEQRAGRSLAKEEAEKIAKDVEEAVVKEAEKDTAGTTEKLVGETSGGKTADGVVEQKVKDLEDTKAEVDARAIEEAKGIQQSPDLTPEEKAIELSKIKERVDMVKTKLDASIEATKATVKAQGDELVTQQEGLAGAVDEAAKAREAATTPGETGVTPQPDIPDPELEAANSVYNDSFDMTDKVLERAGIENANAGAKENRFSKLFHTVAAGGVRDSYKDLVDKARDAWTTGMYKATSGENAVTSALPRFVTLFGNNAALKDATRGILRVRNDAQTAAGDAVRRLASDLQQKIAQNVEDVTGFNMRLDQVFESPEFIARKYGDNVPKLTPDDLPPAEREIFDTLVEMNQMRNIALFKQGRIDVNEYKMFKDGMHSPRIYDFEKEGIGIKGNKLIDNTSTIKRKKLEQISDETFSKIIDSPAQRMLIRLEIALRSQASHDALKALDDAGLLLNRAPNNQFSPLVGKKWGKYEGKVLYNPIKGQLTDEIVMNTNQGKAVDNLLDQWRESPLGTADRFLKKTKTVYSPGTFIGNIFSNPLLFNRGAGVNAIGQTGRMTKASVDLVAHRTGKTFDPSIYEAQRYGVFSSDTGKQITGESSPELAILKESQPHKVFEDTYGGVDDAAKLAIYRTLRGRGMQPELAARRVQQFTQDYNNAGRLVRTLADAPILGKPFARFIPELVRLIKNNVVYNPVGMISGVAMLAYLQNQMQKVSGETDEERDARENAPGQTKIPLTGWIDKLTGGTGRDLSLNFPVGDTAINVARATGLNFPIEPNGDPNKALITALMPWVDPTRKNAQGDTVIAPEEFFSSMLINPLARQVANRDFMGRTITDPENKIYYEGDNGNNVTKYSDELPANDQLWNRIRAAVMAYVPLANETNSLYSATQGKEDYYGKERTVPEAIMRIFGAKAETNDKDARKGRIESKAYFEEDLPAVQKFVRENPDLSSAYFKLKDPSRNRITNQKTSDLITPEKWDIINSDTSGRLFNFLKTQAMAATKKDKKRPLDPIYEVPDDQAKYIAEMRSRPSGDDIEAQEILRATTDWFPAYEDKYFDYLDKNSKYFDNLKPFEGAADPNKRVESYNETSKPIVQPPIIKQYYQIKNKSVDEAKAFYQNNKDALGTAFDTYAAGRLQRINALRKIEGYDPISAETFANATFGFDADGGGYGGFGFGGGGGGGSRTTNTLGDLTNFSATIDRLNPVTTDVPPAVAELFKKLMAGGGGGKEKPRLGASSRGQG